MDEKILIVDDEKTREERNMPIIMISAKAGDMNKIKGLASGADDYNDDGDLNFTIGQYTSRNGRNINCLH